MKPKNKLQAEVLSLSQRLAKINNRIEQWAFKSVIEHKAFRTKRETSCLTCGHQWKGSQTDYEEVCPSCKITVKIEDTRKKKHEQLLYVAMLETKDRFQVNRFFQIRSYHRSGNAPKISTIEITQQWWDINTKEVVIVSRNCGGVGLNYDHWHGDLEIKQFLDKYNLFAEAIHPKSKVQPIFIRNGFTTKICHYHPLDLLMLLRYDSTTETLIKAEQYEMVRAMIYKEKSVKKHWDSLKICIRNNYKISDYSTWLDYMDLLEYFGKDLRSPKYVCPNNLDMEHDRYVKKKQEHLKRLDLEEKKRKAEEANKRYIEAKKAFIGLAFTDGDLTIKVLESVNEFLEESEAHKHCVFTNSYYDKPDSLILSAQVEGNRIETIEISLKKMKPIQARGFENKPSIYNKQIMSLVNKNMRQIRSRYKKNIKEVA